MIKYILRRVLLLIPVMLIISFFAFSLINLMPADAARIAAGENAPRELIDAIREMMGLNYPFFVRYFRWLRDFILYQHLGYSLMSGWPVMTIVLAALPITFRIVFIATLVSVVIGIPIGIISAVKRYSIFDNIGMAFSIIGISIPAFWQALLLHMFILYLVRIGSLPHEVFAGRGDANFFSLLAALILGISTSAIVARFTRSSMLEVIHQNYIKTARAFGKTEIRIVSKHAFKNVLIPIITVVGLNFSVLLAGAIYSEIVFRLDGIGVLLVNAVRSRDYPLLMGAIVLVCLFFSVLNLLIDILYSFIDPRIRSQYK